MKMKLVMLLVLAVAVSGTQVTTVQASQNEAELAIIYYAMANDPVIFIDGRRELIEAEQFAGSDKLNIVAEFSRWPDGDPNGAWRGWTRTQWNNFKESLPDFETHRMRYAFTTNNKDSGRFIQPLAETLTGDRISNVRDNIVNLLHWTHENQRAKRYILIVGAHGSGSAWTLGSDDFTSVASGITGVSSPGQSRRDRVQDKTSQFLGNNIVSQAVANLVVSVMDRVSTDRNDPDFNKEIADRLGVVAFDACLMQTVGVAYELTPTVDKLVAASISMIGMSFEQMIASIVANKTVQPDDLSDAYIDELMREFEADKDFRITNAQIANHVLNSMYEHGKRNAASMSYISSVSDVGLITDRQRSDQDDIAKMLARFADTFLTEAAEADNRETYMRALNTATNRTQRYEINIFNMYGDMAHFFEHLMNAEDLSRDLRNQARDIHYLTKESSPGAETISETNRNLVARMRKREGTQGLKLPAAEGLSILFPFYKVYALMAPPIIDTDDGPLELTDPANIAEWVQMHAVAGKIGDVIAAPGAPADVRYELLRFEALRLNTAHRQDGKKWADLIKEYWEWASANLPTAEAPEITLFRSVDGELEEFGSYWNGDLLNHGYGFQAAGIEGFFFPK